MFLIGELECAGRCELAEAVLWAVEHAASPDQPKPAGVSVAGLQHLLDQRLARVERHLVFTVGVLGVDHRLAPAKRAAGRPGPPHGGQAAPYRELIADGPHARD